MEVARYRNRREVDNNWEMTYKKKCEHYVSLSDIVSRIDSEKLANYVYSQKTVIVYLSDILSYMSRHNISVSDDLALMACESCACKNCKYIQDHLGHDCEGCKQEGYIHQKIYCNEFE